jgi:hypothetical protein
MQEIKKMKEGLFIDHLFGYSLSKANQQNSDPKNDTKSLNTVNNTPNRDEKSFLFIG